MKLDRLTEMVCTNRRANLSKLSRIKLPSIWTNPNHGRIGFIRSHISLPFCILWFQGFFFVLLLKSPFMYIADEESVLEAALGFPQVRYHKPYPSSFIFFETYDGEEWDIKFGIFFFWFLISSYEFWRYLYIMIPTVFFCF